MFFLFKQQTAYGMRISDWSSDVCASDLGHIIPFEKWGEPKPAPAGSRNRALTCPEEITVSNGSPLGEIPGAAASGGFEGGTERNLGGRGDVTACLDPDIFAPVAAELLGAKLRAADRALAGNVIPDIASGDHCIQSRTKLRGSAKSHDRYSLGRGIGENAGRVARILQHQLAFPHDALRNGVLVDRLHPLTGEQQNQAGAGALENAPELQAERIGGVGRHYRAEAGQPQHITVE